MLKIKIIPDQGRAQDPARQSTSGFRQGDSGLKLTVLHLARVWITEIRYNYYIAPAILNIGKYMATTRPPIVTPKNTSIKGSIKEVRLSTAWSTSSS